MISHSTCSMFDPRIKKNQNKQKNSDGAIFKQCLHKQNVKQSSSGNYEREKEGRKDKVFCE